MKSRLKKLVNVDSSIGTKPEHMVDYLSQMLKNKEGEVAKQAQAINDVLVSNETTDYHLQRREQDLKEKFKRLEYLYDLDPKKMAQEIKKPAAEQELMKKLGLDAKLFESQGVGFNQD